MKKILCPTDFSATGYNAITYAAKLAQVTSCDLTLFTVQSLFDTKPVEFAQGTPSTQQATTERLQAQCTEISKVFNISCNAEVEPRDNKSGNVTGDASHLYDLIVMGSNGPDTSYQFFLGSNAYNGLKKARVPILLIPKGLLFSEIKKMVYAFDYLSARKLPLDPLIGFVRAVKCELTVLQVMEEAYSKKAEEDLHELQFILQVRPDGEGVHLSYDTIRSSEVARSIDHYVLEHQTDALALCSVHRNFVESLFHKSVIKDISSVCSYPVFVFHE